MLFGFSRKNGIIAPFAVGGNVFSGTNAETFKILTFNFKFFSLFPYIPSKQTEHQEKRTKFSIF